jgi:hypothetical protein
MIIAIQVRFWYNCIRAPGCSAAWLARLPWEQEAGGSNPSIPTIYIKKPLLKVVFLCSFTLINVDADSLLIHNTLKHYANFGLTKSVPKKIKAANKTIVAPEAVDQ